jgi:PTS system N-acetylglucosamine-specific IIC component
LQVILGPIADQVAGEMRAVLRAGPSDASEPQDLLAALGGAANVSDVQVASTRLCFTVRDDAAVIDKALDEFGAHGVARPNPNRVHVLIGPKAGDMLASLRGLVPAAKG